MAKKVTKKSNQVSSTLTYKNKPMTVAQYEKAVYKDAIKGMELQPHEMFKAFVYGKTNNLPVTEAMENAHYIYLGLEPPNKATGRPSKYKEKTKAIRVPESLAVIIQEKILPGWPENKEKIIKGL